MQPTMWETLGIPPTNDLQALRRAYAVQLRTIDAEVETTAFMALREAYENAQELVRYSHNENLSEFNLTDERTTSKLPGETSDGTLSLTYPYRDNASTQTSSSLSSSTDTSQGNIYIQIMTILQDEEKRGQLLTEEEHYHLAKLTKQLISSFEDSTIDQVCDLEHDLAYLLATTTPRSDAMLHIISNYYGWDQSADNYNQPDTITFIIKRREFITAWATFTEPTHELHDAFVELNSPTKTTRINAKLIRDVRELLETTQKFPSVYYSFDIDRVVEWEDILNITSYGSVPVIADASTSGNPFKWVLIIVFLFSFVGFCADTLPPPGGEVPPVVGP